MPRVGRNCLSQPTMIESSGAEMSSVDNGQVLSYCSVNADRSGSGV